MNDELALLIATCFLWFTAGLIAGWKLCERKCLQVLALARAGRRRPR